MNSKTVERRHCKNMLNECVCHHGAVMMTCARWEGGMKRGAFTAFAPLVEATERGGPPCPRGGRLAMGSAVAVDVAVDHVLEVRLAVQRCQDIRHCGDA